MAERDEDGDGRVALQQLRAIRDSALPATQRAVASAIVLRAGGGQGCWASQATIAADTGLGERTVRRDLTLLVAAGVLSVFRRPGDTDVYVFVGVVSRLSTAPAQDAEVVHTPAPRAGLPRHHVPPTPAPRADEIPHEIPPGKSNDNPPQTPSVPEGAPQRVVWVARWATWSAVDLGRRGDRAAADRFAAQLRSPPKDLVDRARRLLSAALPGQPEGLRRRDLVAGMRLAADQLERGPPPDLPADLHDYLAQPLPPRAPP